MPGAGKLNRRITFQRATTVNDAVNEPVDEAWSDLATVWARRSDVSDGEKSASGQVGAALMSRFVVRSSTTTRELRPTDRIAHAGHSWNIQGIKETAEGRDRFFEITAVMDLDDGN